MANSPDALFLLAFCAAIFGCATMDPGIGGRVPSELKAKGVCQYVPDHRDSVGLSCWEGCAISRLSKRCNAKDRCLIECLRTGSGRNIGGGCWHVCAHSDGFSEHLSGAWEEPDLDLSACDKKCGDDTKRKKRLQIIDLDFPRCTKDVAT
jgi:hypothetical protein